jgi:hypothetical protein
MDEMKTRPLICNERPGDEEDKEEEAEDDYAPLPPETIAASFEAPKPKLIEDNDDSSVPPEQIPAPCERLVDEEEKEEEAEDDYDPLPPETIAASFEAPKPKLIEDNDDASVPPGQIPAPCERLVDEEEKEEEAEDDYAPLPPETIAASFEAPKPKLIEDNVDASVPPEQIPASFERLADEEEKEEEAEDDYAPLPPETIASSFEAPKPKLIEDNDDASVPPELIAAPFEGHGNEEAKQEEAEDDYALLPPEMIAALYELDHDANQKGPKKPEVIEGNVGTNINSTQDVINLFRESGTIMPENGTDSLPEIVDNKGTPVSTEMQPSLANNDQVSVLSMTPTPQMGLNTSLPDHVRMTIYPTPQLMSGSRPSFYPSHQSFPLLEATLVQDVPEEPVYDRGNQGGDESHVDRISDSNLVMNRDSEEVIIATQLEPWWKQRRPQIILCSAIVFAIAFAIALGVILEKSNDELPETSSRVSSSAAPSNVAFPPTLLQLRKEGVLRCGVPARRGFSVFNQVTGEKEGMSVDFCKAVAAAVLGHEGKVELIDVNAATRFPALANGSIDLLIFGDTHTMERDFHEVR